jgi:hypothetical protein
MATAAEAIGRASRILTDVNATRWTRSELCDWLNDAQREVVLHKPTANTKLVTVTLVAGTRQTVPAGGVQFVRGVRNVASKRTIIPTDMRALDDLNPYWHDPTFTPPAADAYHTIAEPEDPTAFWVYPPNNGTGQIEALVCMQPATVPLPGSPEVLANYTTTLELADIYLSAIVDFMVYRALLKDNAEANNAMRAAAHYSAFANALGVKLANEVNFERPS